MSILIIGCDTVESVKSEVEILQDNRSEIQNKISTLNIRRKVLLSEREVLIEEIKELRIYNSGRTPQYILKMEMWQFHFPLDISDHLKDVMNAIEFEIPVDSLFYHSVNIGTDIVDDFRMGSFILNGSFGDWRMRVIKKTIK